MSAEVIRWAVPIVGIIALVVLIARYKLNSALALTGVALGVGLSAGLNSAEVAQSFCAGVGEVLGSVAFVIGFGAILGGLSAKSGAAECVATALVSRFADVRAPWTMAAAGFIVGLPVFFSVGVVLLVPIAATLASQTRVPLLKLGLPLVAALSVMHGLLPPHPGPVAVTGLLQADMGRTIAYGFLVAIPTTILCGPLFGPLLAGSKNCDSARPTGDSAGIRHKAPGLVLSLVTILLPVVLMLFGAVVRLLLPVDSGVRRWGEFIGHPVVAMLGATLFGYWSMGQHCGVTRNDLLKTTEESLAPVAQILLVIGAGGGFSRILTQIGIGDSIVRMIADSHVSPLVLAWLAAAAVRVATGSATVAIVTAAGIVAPAAQGSTFAREWLVLAMGAGSLTLSHVNDGGFWLVKEYLGLSVTDCLKTWTVLETTISVVALLMILLLSRLL